MNDETQKLVEEQFKKLPKSLQKAIESTPWKSSVNEIALLHNLNLEQASLVERETLLVLYGFEDPANYPDNLIHEVKVPEDIALDIAYKVNEKIFSPISNKTDEIETNDTSAKPPQSEKPAESLPMIEPGEVVHNVPHVESKPLDPQVREITSEQNLAETPPEVKLNPKIGEAEKKPEAVEPKPAYPGGKDPYREPIQ